MTVVRARQASAQPLVVRVLEVARIDRLAERVAENETTTLCESLFNFGLAGVLNRIACRVAPVDVSEKRERT